MNEFRVLAEKSTSSPETRDEKNRKVEFATPTFNVLNALEQMGYKVVTSGAFVTGHNKFDQARNATLDLSNGTEPRLRDSASCCLWRVCGT